LTANERKRIDDRFLNSDYQYWTISENEMTTDFSEWSDDWLDQFPKWWRATISASLNTFRVIIGTRREVVENMIVNHVKVFHRIPDLGNPLFGILKLFFFILHRKYIVYPRSTCDFYLRDFRNTYAINKRFRRTQIIISGRKYKNEL